MAVDVFAVNILLASLATQATVLFARRRHLTTGPVDTEAKRAAEIRSGAVVVSALLSIGLAWVNPSVAKYCWFLIAAAPLLANRHRVRGPVTPARSGDVDR